VRAIKTGQKVELTAVAQPGKTYGATVSRIGGEIGKTRSLIVEATLDPQTELVPGMFAEAHITIGEKVLPVVPAEAVVKRGKLWHAFVVVKGEAQDRIVQVGPAAEAGKVAVIQGINKGDKLIAKVTPQVTDGLRVVE
jgi:hypothetical protein